MARPETTRPKGAPTALRNTPAGGRGGASAAGGGGGGGGGGAGGYAKPGGGGGVSALLSGWPGVLLAAAVIVVSVVAIYAHTLPYPFFLDDPVSILGNPTLVKLWPLSGPLHPPGGGGQTVEGRPILNLSLAINYAFTKLSFGGFRATNIGIHAAAALVLMGVVRRTFRRLWPEAPGQALLLGASAALVWAVHPLQTESVTYIVQRAESLMGLFFLLTLYGFVRATEGDGPDAAGGGAAGRGGAVPLEEVEIGRAHV